MPVYTDEGVVLRTVKLGEADRIITMLTRDHGKIRAVARGVRRTKSRFGARLEPFMRDQLLVARGRSLDVVSQAVCVGAYADPICQDYDAYLNANLIVETADKLVTSEEEAVVDQYRLLVGALAALSRKERPSWQIGQSYVLRSLRRAGWSPRLNACVVCGRRDQLEWFSVPSGGVVCSDDRTPDCHHMTHEQAELLFALLMGNWDDCKQDPAADSVVESLVEEWAQFYLERPLRTAHLIHS
ncbi:MAG: DNA repair protein RecO [Bifidobacteriaceae bacterium]|nr:DNA repair protein RecO [Bifidobacteriaceae bacterium]